MCGPPFEACSTVFQRLAVLPQYLIPKRMLTVLAGKFAGGARGNLTTAVIRWFIKRYGVNMAEAANPDPASYATFNDFFTRSLCDGARTLADAAYVCPVDGTVSQLGPITEDQIYQAKGHHYSTTALLGGDSELAAHFDNGEFTTLYLSPRDYHRVHMPCDGTLVRMTYVPGALFSVNPVTVRGVPGLFARNERVVCVFDSPLGPFVMVLVGATIVGSVATVWHGQVNPPRRREVTDWHYDEAPVELQQGDEMGRFQLGSTVVLLFAHKALAFHPSWAPSRAVRLGETMGRVPRPATQDEADQAREAEHADA